MCHSVEIGLDILSNHRNGCSFSRTYQITGPIHEHLVSAGETAPVTVIAEDIQTNFYAMTQGLDQGTEYSWCVIALDGQGGATKSTSVFSFLTAENGVSNSPPNPFVLFSPFDGQENVELSPQLNWQQAVDPEGDPVTYDVFLGAEGTFLPMISNMNPNLSTIPISLNYDTWYEWDVVAYDNKGFYRWADVEFYFKTMAEPQPISMSMHTSNSSLQSDGRYGHQTVIHNGELYTIGGLVVDAGDGGDRNDVWKTSDRITWTQVRAHDVFDLYAPHPSTESQVLSYGGLLYVFNGERNTIQTSSDGVVWNQVPWEGNVSEGTHYPPLQGHQVVEFQGDLLVIGGSSGGQVKNDVWRSSDGGITWEEISDHSFPARRDHQVVVVENELILMGGVGSGQRMNDVWFSSDGITWSEYAVAEWSPRSNFHAAVFNDAIYVIGGDPGGGDSDEIWVFDLFNSLYWEQVETHPDYGPRENHFSVVFQNALYIEMGKNGAVPLNDVWKIE
ncbi:MAG: hypothetical protein HKN79_12715 [Flavobacteriales bacterium]|nr:hypothetical protein [Flavobacteriales bacterium]